MSDTKFVRAEVFPLAEFLYDEMKARGWQTQDVVIRMGTSDVHEIAVDLCSLDLLMVVQSDNLIVGDKLFAKLAKAFDVSEQMLRALDGAWREFPERRSPFDCPEDVFGPISRASVRPRPVG